MTATPRETDTVSNSGPTTFDWTYEGKVHDKALADAEALCFSAGLVLRQDTGYQGYVPIGAVVAQPTKKPRKAELSATQKLVNQSISTMRVVVEHAIGGIKRLHYLGHGLRLRGWSIRDELMQAGTGSITYGLPAHFGPTGLTRSRGRYDLTNHKQ